MKDRTLDVPDEVMSDASNDTQDIETSQTSSHAGESDLSGQLREVTTQLRTLNEQYDTLQRQVQSQGDRLLAKLEKKIRKNTEALKTAAELEGWDESTLKEKLQTANTRLFATLGTDELEEMNHTRDETLESPRMDAPDTHDAHATMLRNYLNSLGLNEKDLGNDGIVPYIGQPDGSPAQREFVKRVGKAIERKEELAKQLAQKRRREEFADEVAEEAEEYGNIGGTGERTGGQGASMNNAQRLINEEYKKYRGTGRGAEWLERRRELERKYSVSWKPPTG